MLHTIKRFSLTLLVAILALTAMAQKDTIRVLSIGNSYARDAFGYVPMLVEELSPTTYVEFGILYIGGCTLQTHWANASAATELTGYEYDFYTTGQQKWVTMRNYSLQRGVRHNKWDLVIMQQQSYASMDYKTHVPYLFNLVDYLRSALPGVRFAWHFTPSYPDGSQHLTGNITSELMWRRTSIAAQQVMLHDDFRFVIPTGTGIQNARGTMLDRYGKFGHMSYEGLHTEDGIPCLVEGYVAAQSLLNFYGREADFNNSQLRVTQEWAVAKAVPQRHGVVPADITETDYLLAKACAGAALKSPYQLTPISVDNLPEVQPITSTSTTSNKTTAPQSSTKTTTTAKAKATASTALKSTSATSKVTASTTKKVNRQTTKRNTQTPRRNTTPRR